MEKLENKKEDNSIDYEKELLKEKRKNYVLRLVNTFCDTISVFLLTVLILFSVLCGYVLGAKGNEVVDDIYDKIQQEENSQRQESNRRLLNNNTPVPSDSFNSNDNGSGSNCVGTVVPNTGYVEKVYVNTSLSNDEILSILSNINYNFLGFMYIALVSSYNEVLDIEPIVNLLYMDGMCAIASSYGPIFASEGLLGEFGFEGWYPEFNGVLEINSNVLSTFEDDGLVFSVGTQNDKLTSLFSLTPFVCGVEPDEDNIISVLFNAIYQGTIGMINPFVESIKVGFQSFIFEYVEGGKPLMQGDYVEKLYFNKSLSSSQVNSYIDLVLKDINWSYDTINTYYKLGFVYSDFDDKYVIFNISRYGSNESNYVYSYYIFMFDSINEFTQRIYINGTWVLSDNYIVLNNYNDSLFDGINVVELMSLNDNFKPSEYVFDELAIFLFVVLGISIGIGLIWLSLSLLKRGG